MALVLVNLDLGGNQILGLRLETLAGDPSGGALYAGRIWFNSTDHLVKFYDGTAVVPWGTGGGGVATLTVDGLTIENTGTATNPILRVKAGGITNNEVGTGIAFAKLAAPAADFDMNSHKIIGLATPTAGTDAVNKNYVDAAVNGLDWKASVRAATTANGTLATAYANGQTIDGVTLATGDRILLKNQTTGADNGLYTVNASGAPTRATDADASVEVTAGLAVFVSEGTLNGNTAWVLTTDDPIVVGTTALVFAQIGAGTAYSAGTGIDLTGTVFSLQSPVTIAHGGTGQVTAAAALAALGGTTKFAALIGDGSSTTLTVTHNLGTRDVVVTVYDASTFAVVLANVVHATTNTVTVNFAVAPASNAYRVVVVG